jgi:hypothetical protein
LKKQSRKSSQRARGEISGANGIEIDRNWNCLQKRLGQPFFGEVRGQIWNMLIRFKSKPLSGRERARRAVLIANVVQQRKPPDLDALRQIAIQDGGFLSSQIRSKVWPALLTLPVDNRLSGEQLNVAIMREQDHRDKRQVELDVRRSLSHFGLSKRERNRLLPRLSMVIDSVLARHSDLHYYQVW